MDGKGSLLLRLLDVSGNALDDKADISLKHMQLSESRDLRGVGTQSKRRFTYLTSTHGGTYRLMVYPTRHRPVSRFVHILEGKTEQLAVMFPIQPQRVRGVRFPEYESLDDELKSVLERSHVEATRICRARRFLKPWTSFKGQDCLTSTQK